MESPVEENKAGVTAALERALGHPPPFTDGECTSFDGTLTVWRAESLEGVERCERLTGLEVFASDVPSLEPLGGLKRLRALRTFCCSLDDLNGVTGCPSLEEVELIYAWAENMAPLLELPRLMRGQFVGCPWLPESWSEIRPQLLTLRHPDQTGPPVLGFSSEADWRMTREVWERGIDSCFAHYLGRPLYVRPGIPRIPNTDFDLVMCPRMLLKELIKRDDFSDDSVFGFLLGARDGHSPRNSFNIRAKRAIGNAGNARRWVEESSLGAEDRAALIRFVERFPRSLFYRENDELLDSEEARLNVKLPLDFREIRKTLAFAMPYHITEVEFDPFPQWSLPSELANRNWFEIGLRGVDNEDQQSVLDDHGLFPIGAWLPNAITLLAIQVKELGDPRIFSYYPEDIREDGRLPKDAIREVAPSYASLMANISAFHLDSSEVIRAHNG